VGALWHAGRVPGRITGEGLTATVRDSSRDLGIAATAIVWIGAVLLVDAVAGLAGAEAVRQILLGAGTWGVLLGLLRREPGLVRTQTMVVVALATCVEYTFSPLLQAYVYRIGTVPLFVPPGHGLVYLAALALGRSPLFQRHSRVLVAATVLVGGGWAVWGVVASGRVDALGAFWFCCLLGFLAWGPSRMVYVGAFVVVSYLELAGTALGTWAWATSDPVLHVIGQGNPPSGAPGGYGWFDLYALLLAPRLLPRFRRLRDAVLTSLDRDRDRVIRDRVNELHDHHELHDHELGEGWPRRAADPSTVGDV
jgi:hypothetical protein